jgi:hypothetical protein
MAEKMTAHEKLFTCKGAAGDESVITQLIMAADIKQEYLFIKYGMVGVIR